MVIIEKELIIIRIVPRAYSTIKFKAPTYTIDSIRVNMVNLETRFIFSYLLYILIDLYKRYYP